ncbi:hypothetical protein [Streptomyces yaizuensis]|uniref:TrbL/VirB6 plasmid conjugal transfer protein n=1 Tax=Streptomyces yaizuensis TaxID=2989713 RepID=A0ABQ5P6Q8_9ACTN|nr:hypothetical protein [Streptomyces sp. YSPA8]GLF98281.1 hypothetical protein SYYSPA8_28310 [Streptomyces sp. YSPA8]
MNAVMNRLCTLLLQVWVRLPRLRALLTPTAALLATCAVLAPAAAADDSGEFKPGGIGDMMPSPVTPPGQGTLYESYDPDVYQLDKQLSDDLTGGDLIPGWLHGVGSVLMIVLTVIGKAAVVVTSWCFNVVSLPEVEGAISRAISAAAEPMMTVFMPTAVAVGMFIAWARRSDQSMLGQLAWVFASAAIATTFLVAPQTWVNGVDDGRQLGASVAMTTIGSGMSGQDDAAVPFRTPEPAWSGDEKSDTIRRASDSVWRTYVATPWCIANLGSLNACQKWGAEVVKRGTDMEEREDYLADNLDIEAVGDAAVQWRQGHTPGGRIGVLIAGIVSAVIFCGLVITLAFTTLASLLGALMLLVCGVVFATLWCIPGKPRQWGVQWFEMLIGLVVVSFTATMLLGTVMVVSIALMSLLPTYGWLMVSALNITAAVMAFRVKGRLDGIVGAGGAQMAGRGILNGIGRMAQMRRMGKLLSSKRDRGGLGDMDRHPSPGGKDGSGGDSPTAGAGSRTRTHQTRTFPSPPSRPRPGAGGDYAAQPGTIERLDQPGPGGDGPAAARRAKAEIVRRKAGGTGPAAIGDGPRPGGPDGPEGGRGPGGPGGPGAPRDGRGPGAPAGPGSAGDGRQGAPGGGSYPMRPGAPRRTGVPEETKPTGDRVIQGTVIKRGESPADPVGSRFRQYPPPPPAPSPARAAARRAGAAAGRAAVDTAVTGAPLPELPPPGSSDS